MWLIGEMLSVFIVVDIIFFFKLQLDYEDIFFGLGWCCVFGGCGEFDVIFFVDIFGYVFGNFYDGLCFEDSVWSQIEEWEFWFSVFKIGYVCMGF